MKITTRRSSLSTLFAVLLLAVVVKANFFSRLANFKADADKVKSCDNCENRTADASPSAVSSVQGSTAPIGNSISMVDGVPFARLNNKGFIPLVGLGAGNLKPDKIPQIVAAAIQDDKKIRLIDTAKTSQNEALVAAGLVQGAKTLEKPVEVHVVAKVWYTHLGYARTKYSVQETLKAFAPAIQDPKIDLKVHVLLHWSRCFADIPWMQCEKEEQELPQEVRALGPNPAADPEQAWKESWKALEDLYMSTAYPQIASIGVSNFVLDELVSLQDFARVMPQMTQVDMWSLLYDPNLVDFCNQHQIHVQAYNTLAATVKQSRTAPRALHHVQQVQYDLSSQMQGTPELSPAQVILSWLIQHGVSVIPRTSKLERLAENSPLALSNMPALTDHQVETLAHTVEAYLSGEDLQQDIHVTVSFYADTKDMVLYWVGNDGEEIRIALIRKGNKFDESTYPSHQYRTYLASNKDVYVDHAIGSNFGEHMDIHVTL